jgi:acyl-CoA synthetase (AMP-forming)/AMP-acid ligase II
MFVHPARGFEPLRILEIIDRAAINFISLVPTHYAMLLEVPPEQRRRFDVSSINKLLCSSAPARMEHKKAIMEWFRGVSLYEGYGSTEAGIVTTLMPDEQLTKVCSIGRESLGTDFVKVLDENKQPVPDGEIGEIYSRGPMMFDGYYKAPEKTAAAFAGEWFSAGDMGYRDEDGYYFLVDRKNNLIITGGENVYPREVEAILDGLGGVAESAVIGLPDEDLGEAVTAAVVAADPAAPPDVEALRSRLKERLAGFKVPRRIFLVGELPRNAMGKVQKERLRRELRADP